MGHRGPPAAPGQARARVQVCQAQAAHRRGNRSHTHIHTRTRQSTADARSPIHATRHLVFPGHRLIHTPARQRTLTPCGTLGFPRVIAWMPDPSNLRHQSDRVGSLVRVHQFKALVLWCPEAKKALAFPKNSFSFSSSRTRRRRAVISASISRGSGRPSRTAWRYSRSSLTHRPTTDSPSPKSRAADTIVDPVSNTRHATSRRYSGVKRRREPITGTSLAAGTRTRLTKRQQHQPKPKIVGRHPQGSCAKRLTTMPREMPWHPQRRHHRSSPTIRHANTAWSGSMR